MPFFAPIANCNWKIADALASTRFCTPVAEPPLQYVRDAGSLVQLPNPILVPDRPHARLTFCSLFAVWRCLCPVRHSHHYVFLHLWERRWMGARSCSRHVPVALLGCSYVLRFVLAGRCWCLCQRAAGSRHSLNRQLPSVLQPSSWQLCTCQPRLQNPIALFHMFRACACSTVAVSLSISAQSQLSLP
jgi:hypothetical protein